MVDGKESRRTGCVVWLLSCRLAVCDGGACDAPITVSTERGAFSRGPELPDAPSFWCARFVPVSAGSTRPISMTRVSVRNEPSTAPASSPPQPLRDSGCQREDTRVAARAWGVNGLGYSALTVGAPRSPGYAPRPPPGNRASAEDGRRCAGCSSREVYVDATPPSTTLAVRHLALNQLWDMIRRRRT
jgi:hypothetical protein